ncbi:MAG: PHP domain-containing protein [Deltaproteobacteria bacterium]|nr:PHP domain-containing protein [Deltaproteobacteria bacterium]
MRRRLVKSLLALLAVAAAAAGYVAWPRGYGAAGPAGRPAERGTPFDGPLGRNTYAGAVHVHVEGSSDSRLHLVDAVAEARAAGLGFLVVTDHDTPQPLGDVRARWQDGVLLVGGTEWSTDNAHLLDLSATPGRGPFPVVQAARADCRRRGGPCVASHPTAWRRPWRPALAGVDGLEIHGSMAAVGDLVAAPFLELGVFTAEVLLAPSAGLWDVGAFEEPAVVLWEAWSQVQPLGAWCGADLHGLLPVRQNVLAFLAVVGLEAPLAQDAAAAAAQLRAALGSATCVNALAGMVDGVAVEHAEGRITARARIRGQAGPAVLRLVHGGREQARTSLSDGLEATVTAPALPGAWRAVVEVDAPGPWGRRARPAAIRLLQVPPGSSG